MKKGSSTKRIGFQISWKVGVAGALCLFAAIPGAASAAIIIPTGVTASSELSEFGLLRFASTTIDGSGMNIGYTGVATDTSSAPSGIGLEWTSDGSIGGTPDYNPEITFDLGAMYDITAINVWNSYNSAPQFGIKDVEIFTSSDGVIYSSAGTTNLTSNTTGASQVVSLSATNVRYVKFDILSNLDGAIFDGTGATPGADGRSLAALGEVAFVGTAVPEPGSAVLIALGSGALLFRRRRGF